MNNYTKPTDWVKESIELDLVYDEGQYDELKHEEEHYPSKLTGHVIEYLPTDGGAPRDWFKHFINLKKVRIYNGLKLEMAQHKCAVTVHEFLNNNSNSNNSNNSSSTTSGDFSDAFAQARDRRKEWDDDLNKATWRCCSSIDTLLRKYNEETESINKQKWATLIALYYSELCACARSELSLAAANELYVADWLEKAEHSEVFRYIALHSAAIGENHAKRHLVAARRLDTGINRIESLCKKGNGLDDLLWRFLFLPATRTLVSALSDLMRYSECRYYSDQGLSIARNCKKVKDGKSRDYWDKSISLDKFMATVDSGQIVAREEKKIIFTTNDVNHPRLEAQRRVALCHPSLQSNDPDSRKQWVENELWSLGWHAVEPRQIGQRLKSMIEESREIYRLRERRANQTLGSRSSAIGDTFRQDIEELQDLLVIVRILLGAIASDKTHAILFMIGDYDSNKIPPRDLETLWELAQKLFKLLDDIPATHHAILKWKDALICNLESAEREHSFHEVCSEVSRLELLPQLMNQQNIPCPNSQGWDRHTRCKKGFVYGCAYEVINGPRKDDNSVSWSYYSETISDQDKQFLRYLEPRTGPKRQYIQGGKYVKEPPFIFVSLRRWNSFSPNLGSSAMRTVGGGYFVRAREYEKDRYIGIAVDPGYNFLENLFSEGYSIADIDVIAITHAHPDHTENLTNILTLIYERNRKISDRDEIEKLTCPHKPILITTEGVFESFHEQLKSYKLSLEDIIVVASRQSEHADDAYPKRAGDACYEPVCFHVDGDGRLKWQIGHSNEAHRPIVEVSAAPAWHYDRTRYDSVGLIITYNSTNGSNENIQHHLGIIGDTRYHCELKTHYEKCMVLVTHIGSLVDPTDDLPQDGYERLNKLHDLLQKNHLYLPGFTHFLCDMKDASPLYVLSEFGEELRGGLRTDIVRRIRNTLRDNSGLRTDIVRRLCNTLKEKYGRIILPNIIPADVGLRIDLVKREILCCICHRYVEYDSIKSTAVLPDNEALVYVCRDCIVTRHDELPNLLEEWCRTARPLPPPLPDNASGSTDPSA